MSPLLRRGPARFREISRTDLTSHARSTRYSPDPTQGTQYRIDSGVVWWGAGPVDGPPRPTLILLHGSGRNGQSMINMWHEVAAAQGVVLIAPDFDSIQGWDKGLPDPRSALAVLAPASGLYPVDTARIVHFDHLRGGIAAQVWANRFDGPWRAVAVHAGTLSEEHVIAVETGVPVRHYLGSVDRVFPFGPARDAGRTIAAAGHPFELVRLEGQNHWLYERGEDIAADAWVRLEE
ncbi:hypothetical protein SAMN05444004_10798 [Jannaschia faecimaris]|uniref:Alpha/beta hydrolase n=1 Tax=Jannaschia faecimaris TaxID=1244108 RepID=A0A1H3QZR5_9RHOB|nr:hypothetical protein [Jannaschia faecimaris]SDZ19034.1 hypothetical protein SAMN05444004_10798 [Jannaschia faecimaris]